MSTLRYAGRAMNIKNTAVKNEDVSGPPVSFAEVGVPVEEKKLVQPINILTASGLAMLVPSQM